MTAIPESEAELRTFTPPRHETAEELAEFICALTAREHDYGTSVYAVSIAAYAAFRFAAQQLGITGFQASCADFDVLRRTRLLEGPFMLVDGEKALYPQYDLPARLTEFLDEIRPWLGERARAKLATTEGSAAHPNVITHWEVLALVKPAESPQA